MLALKINDSSQRLKGLQMNIKQLNLCYKLAIIFLCIVLFPYISLAKQLIIAGPMANVTHPFIVAKDNNFFTKTASEVTFMQWKTPDELRAMIVKDSADIYLLPTNVAATLINLKVKLKFSAVSIWGILSIVSTDPKIKNLEDLQGQEILVPFRGDMPDLILQALIKQKKLTNKIHIKYVGTPIEALQLLLLRRENHVLLAEPATSMAISKTSSFPMKIVAPSLYRAIDIQKEWGKSFNTKEIIPQAGIAFSNRISKELIKDYLSIYKKGLDIYKSKKNESANIVAKEIKLINSEAIAESINWAKIELKTAKESKTELENFFKILFDLNPNSIGGNIPSAEFYD